MVWKVKQWYLVVTWVLYWWLLLVFGSGWSGKVKIWPRMGLVYIIYILNNYRVSKKTEFCQI